MRLVDKWIMHTKKQHPSIAENPPVSFVIDNIASDYFHDERDEFEASDFPYAVPPWNVCFVEWIQPRTVRRDGCVYPTQVSALGTSTVQMGAGVCSIGSKKGCLATLELLKSSCEKSDAFPAFVSKAESCDRVFAARIFSECFGRFTDWELCLFVFTDKDGLAAVNILVGEGLNKAATDEQRKAINDVCQSVYHILGFAFTFAHCKNVEKIDSTNELQPTAKIMRRLSLPSMKRYTLKIDGAETGRGVASGVGRSPAYHLCRGHFANYTPERPLFGKLTGKFWIPAHTKGNRKSGSVEKNYTT